jgi:hypothetical protein
VSASKADTDRYVSDVAHAKNCVCRGLPIPAIKGSVVLPTIGAWIVVTAGGMPVTGWIVVSVGPRRVTVGVRVIVITVSAIEGSNHHSRFGWIGNCCDGKHSRRDDD